jgi:hypothetical protein
MSHDERSAELNPIILSKLSPAARIFRGERPELFSAALATLSVRILERREDLECGGLSPLFLLWRLVAKAGPRSAGRENNATPRSRSTATTRLPKARTSPRTPKPGGCGDAALRPLRLNSNAD